MKYRYPFIRPKFPNANIVAQDFEEIIKSNWFTNFGPFEKRFTDRVAGYVGNDVSVTTIANATLGLSAAIKLLMLTDVRKRDVLLPSFTFAAGAEVVIDAGLRPVLIDIEQDSLQPSVDQARRYIENKQAEVAGILLGNTFGVGNKQVREWELLAEAAGIPLIIDSAAGFGSMYVEGERLGSRGDCEIFSLHATKPFAVGEGGLIVSKNRDLINNIRSYQNFGFDSDKKITLVGTNAKLQELNCAIGLRQLDDFDARLELRRAGLMKYRAVLEPLNFKFMDNINLSTVCFVSVVAPSEDIALKLRTLLIDSGVEVRQYYEPLHHQSLVNGYADSPFSLNNTEGVYSRIISLPMYDEMSTDDIDYILDVIKGSGV